MSRVKYFSYLGAVHKLMVSKKVIIPAKAGIQFLSWLPPFVGMTSGCRIKSGMTEKTYLKKTLFNSNLFGWNPNKTSIAHLKVQCNSRNPFPCQVLN